ncbi:hypothetical protein PAPHI01_0002 [Pancytospora philotis]|nr:hypothetical protein PAPHI01_0002 [Pancytospora philotis]
MALEKYKHWRMKVVLVDRQELEGDLIAEDKDGNIMLKNAELHSGAAQTQFLGLVGIRGAAVCSFEVLSKPYRKVARNQ